MPGSLVTAIFSLVAGRMYDKVGIRRLYLIGTCALLAGHSALVFLTAETSLWLVAFVFAVRSIGIGMLMMTTVNWGMSAVAAQYTSDGTALISSLRTVGGAMGTAVFVAVMSAAGGPQGEALLHGLQAAFAGVSMLSALLVILAIVCVGKEERPKNFDCNKEKHHAG
ncbi:MAG: MFS transporter [Ruthenibacterium lactatiformans]